MSGGRTTAVAQLALALEAHFGDTVKQVYGYLPDSFDGVSPVIAVYASGSRRMGASNRFGNEHRVYIYLAAVYSVPNVAQITEEHAQQTLNNLSDGLDAFVERNRSLEGVWNVLGFLEEFSEVTPLNMGSQPYFVEIVPVTLTVY